jgi:GNAT superfamily N-acetyltransferase
MAGSLDLRPAKRSDAAELAELWREFGEYYEDIDPRQFQTPAEDGLLAWITADLDRDRSLDELWLVAERNGTVVGYVRAQILRPDHDAPFHILRTVGTTTVKTDSSMVTDDERRSGVASELMAAVEEWGRERGATEAFVISYARSPTSVPFYEQRMGYRVQTTGYWKPLEDGP